MSLYYFCSSLRSPLWNTYTTFWTLKWSTYRCWRHYTTTVHTATPYITIKRKHCHHRKPKLSGQERQTGEEEKDRRRKKQRQPFIGTSRQCLKEVREKKWRRGQRGRGAETHFRKVETVDGSGTWGLWAGYTLAKTTCCLHTVRGRHAGWESLGTFTLLACFLQSLCNLSSLRWGVGT